MSQHGKRSDASRFRERVGIAGFLVATLVGIVALTVNAMQPPAAVAHSLRVIETAVQPAEGVEQADLIQPPAPVPPAVASAPDEEVLGVSVQVVEVNGYLAQPVSIEPHASIGRSSSDATTFADASDAGADDDPTDLASSDPAPSNSDSSDPASSDPASSESAFSVPAFSVPVASERNPQTSGQSTARQLAMVEPPAAVPVAPAPAPVGVDLDVSDISDPSAQVPAAAVIAAPTAVPESTPVQASAPSAPVVALPTPVPTLVPAQVALPATGRSGPPGVVSQIPASVYAWIDAHGWTISWRQGPGPGRIAEAQYATSTIVIWYDTTRSDATWAGAVGHELGHAVSYRHFSNDQMNEWNEMRGLSSWRWVPGSSNDFSVGEGDFAEAFMHYVLGHPIRSVGGPLTSQQRAWIAANTPF